mgnify:CR=1 FL=1
MLFSTAFFYADALPLEKAANMNIPKSSDLFEMNLSPEEARMVDEFIPVKKFAKGDVLLSEGDVPDAAFYVIDGLVRAYIITYDGVAHGRFLHGERYH